MVSPRESTLMTDDAASLLSPRPRRKTRARRARASGKSHLPLSRQTVQGAGPSGGAANNVGRSGGSTRRFATFVPRRQARGPRCRRAAGAPHRAPLAGGRRWSVGWRKVKGAAGRRGEGRGGMEGEVSRPKVQVKSTVKWKVKAGHAQEGSGPSRTGSFKSRRPSPSGSPKLHLPIRPIFTFRSLRFWRFQRGGVGPDLRGKVKFTFAHSACQVNFTFFRKRSRTFPASHGGPPE